MAPANGLKSEANMKAGVFLQPAGGDLVFKPPNLSSSVTLRVDVARSPCIIVTVRKASLTNGRPKTQSVQHVRPTAN